MQLLKDYKDELSILTTAQHVVVFTGAGVSKESGLLTFREANGIWSKYDPQELASVEGFQRDPDKIWQWYTWRRTKVQDVVPNPAHLAIAELDTLFPRVIVVTQNVDNLHQRAGSQTVLELHGNINRFKCANNCRGNPTQVSSKNPNIQVPQRCPYCGAYTRPDVVWFGEKLPVGIWERASQEILTCELMLVVGTSGVVEPAASLPWYAKRYGATLIEVNPQHTPITQIADISLQGPAGAVLPSLVEALRTLQQDSPN